jgi:hypothetical protein
MVKGCERFWSKIASCDYGTAAKEFKSITALYDIPDIFTCGIYTSAGVRRNMVQRYSVALDHVRDAGRMAHDLARCNPITTARTVVEKVFIAAVVMHEYISGNDGLNAIQLSTACGAQQVLQNFATAFQLQILTKTTSCINCMDWSIVRTLLVDAAPKAAPKRAPVPTKWDNDWGNDGWKKDDGTVPPPLKKAVVPSPHAGKTGGVVAFRSCFLASQSGRFAHLCLAKVSRAWLCPHVSRGVQCRKHAKADCLFEHDDKKPALQKFEDAQDEHFFSQWFASLGTEFSK